MGRLMVSETGGAVNARPSSVLLFPRCARKALEEASGNNDLYFCYERSSNCSRRVRVAEFVVPSEAHALATLRINAAKLASQVGAPPDALCDIELAVGEAITNAYKHGSPDKGSNLILMRCAVCERAFAVEIQDQGPAFDPDFIGEPDPHSLREDGMGIYLMRCVMDVVEIESELPGNRVRMIKWLCR
ncbi:MAG: ATP-binding protein [Armatimonadota bacterium]|nr:ATP-binding protein [Armatimonadota bacterium]